MRYLLIFCPCLALDMGLLKYLSTVNSEPIGIFVSLARSIKDGAGITEQLLFDKVFLYQLYPFVLYT